VARSVNKDQVIHLVQQLVAPVGRPCPADTAGLVDDVAQAENEPAGNRLQAAEGRNDLAFKAAGDVVDDANARTEMPCRAEDHVATESADAGEGKTERAGLVALSRNLDDRRELDVVSVRRQLEPVRHRGTSDDQLRESPPRP
jgi:hypothetical protein